MHENKTSIQDIIAGIDIENIDKHPNILIAAHFWEKKRLEAAITCYRFMRTVDDLIDDKKTKDETLSCMDKELYSEKVNKWIECLNGVSVEDSFLKEVSKTIETFRIPLSYFNNFARSMIYDIHNNSFPTFQDFLDYSEGASNGPASVFVHLACLEALNGSYVQPFQNIADLARPCALFSYIVHIIRDFQKDQEDNLNYFASDVMELYDLDSSDLREIAGGAPISSGFRGMIGFYQQKALEYKGQVEETLRFLQGKMNPGYFFSLELIFDLYLQVFERIDADRGIFSTKALNPTPYEVRERVNRLISRVLS